MIVLPSSRPVEVSQTAQQRRGTADRGEYRQAAGAVAEAVARGKRRAGRTRYIRMSNFNFRIETVRPVCTRGKSPL